MRVDRHDPGECVVCGAAHCACGGGGPITVVQLPRRDAAALEQRADEILNGRPGGSRPTGIIDGAANSTLLGDGTDGKPFSTGSYRGTKKKP